MSVWGWPDDALRTYAPQSAVIGFQNCKSLQILGSTLVHCTAWRCGTPFA